MSTQFLAPVAQTDEDELDRSLRPRCLDDFIGQERIKEQLAIALQAALASHDWPANGQIQNYQDARTALNTVMQQAQSVQGLTPSVVAFEFANASIDTLDKFSGLEPADPGSNGHLAERTGRRI